MAPDIPYFFALGDLRGTTHDPLGIVTIDLGLGLALTAYGVTWSWFQRSRSSARL